MPASHLQFTIQIEQAALALAKEYVSSSRVNTPTDEFGLPLSATDVARLLLGLPR